MNLIKTKIREIENFKKKILFIEFEDLFEYLYLSCKIIEIIQQSLLKLKDCNNEKIKSCYIFAAAVSDFYIPIKKMVH